MAAVAATETGRMFMAAEMKGRVGRTEPGPEAGEELAEGGARRAVADFWGCLQGFAQFEVPKRGSTAAGSYRPIMF
jgi:hypothetical protein